MYSQVTSTTPPTNEKISNTNQSIKKNKTKELKKNKVEKDINDDTDDTDSVYRNASQTFLSEESNLKNISVPEETTTAILEDLKTIKQFSEENEYLFDNPRRRKRSEEKKFSTTRKSKIGETIYNYDTNTYYDTRDLPIVRHPYGDGKFRCAPLNQSNCEPERIVFKAHGPQTGMCVNSDR